MELIRLKEPGAWERIRAAQGRLRALGGPVSKQSADKTRAIFGAPLTPAQAVRRILQDVRKEGDRAVFRYARSLDLFDLNPDNLRVGREEVERARTRVSDKFVEAAKAAIARVCRFQERIKPPQPEPLKEAGVVLRMLYRPLRRVGVYVPGFSASLPSSLIMTAVPAQVAGVKELALATPPDAQGRISPGILTVCALLGIDEIYRIGGAQAIAALAYGTESVPHVDKVAGPGNVFTTLAKREVFGQCDIDILAGPSEVLVIADDTANPAYVAADLLGQAEHNPAAVYLVTMSEVFAERVQRQIDEQLETLERRHQAQEVLDRFGVIILAGSLPECAGVADQIAPEHLQIQTADDDAVLRIVQNAGAIFVGPYTPVAVGDYYAGPSHTLPTGGTARFTSGVSVHDFLRRYAVIRYDREALRAQSAHIIELAEHEGLTGHARSVRIRLEDQA